MSAKERRSWYERGIIKAHPLQTHLVAYMDSYRVKESSPTSPVLVLLSVYPASHATRLSTTILVHRRVQSSQPDSGCGFGNIYVHMDHFVIKVKQPS